MSEYNPPDPLPPPLPVFNTVNWIIPDEAQAGVAGPQGPIGPPGPNFTLYTQAYGATTTFDIDTNGPLQKVTLTGSPTLAVTVSTNRTFVLLLTQGGGGSNTVTWFSTIAWAGGSPPTLTTTIGKTDTFGFIRTSAGNYLGYIIGLDA